MGVTDIIERAKNIKWWTAPMRDPEPGLRVERIEAALCSLGPSVKEDLADINARLLQTDATDPDRRLDDPFCPLYPSRDVAKFHRYLRFRACLEVQSRLVATLRAGQRVKLAPINEWNGDARRWLLAS